ncbi:hypothetical protein [Sulfitobacter sp. F26169L]|nr:hypothetical protein [Sulfitobacter sp. F26169L]
MRLPPVGTGVTTILSIRLRISSFASLSLSGSANRSIRALMRV